MDTLRHVLILLLLCALTQVAVISQPELLFGQVAIGSQGDLEIQSVISATNSGSITYEGDFSFFTGNGTVWNPMVDGVEISNGQHSISIPPFETISLTLSGAEIEAGSAILRGTGPPTRPSTAT